MRTMKLTTPLILSLSLALAACETPEECPESESLDATTYDVTEEEMAGLESAFGVDRSELPCEAACVFAYSGDEQGTLTLETSACELTLQDSSEDPDAVVAQVECEGELFYICD